jgi:ethanolamine utilization protein EutA
MLAIVDGTTVETRDEGSIVFVGIDIGSTTTSGLLARAVPRGAADRRSELTDVEIVERSEPVFTPFAGQAIDAARLVAWLDDWWQAPPIAAEDVAGGGAIVTGLAAQASNAAVVRSLVRERFGNALIATADDPALESWLAFMGNCRDLSLSEPARPFVNLDIGGGTTNIALGLAGQVRRVGCYRIGARHIQFEPGSYRLAALSNVGRRLLDALNIARSPGDVLSPPELHALVDLQVETLEAIIAGEAHALPGETAHFLEQVPYAPADDEPPLITLSGGVGELVYRAALGGELPGTTVYGDLGIDLAQRILQSPRLSANLRDHAPLALGRATVLGLAVHHVQLSGSTLFLPHPERLPWADLPIVGRLTWPVANGDLLAALALAARSERGACLVLELADGDYQTVRDLGGRLAAIFSAGQFPAARPLALLVNQNVGQALGQYATGWRRLDVNLIVLDELPDRGAAFVTIGKPRGPLVPVSFYGV